MAQKKLFVHTIDITSTFRIHDITTKRQCWTYELDKDKLGARYSAHAHPSGFFIVSRYDVYFSKNLPDTFYVLDLKKNQRMIMLQAPQPLAGSCVLSENGKYVAGIVRGSPSGKVIVWRLPEDYTKNELTGTLVTEVSHGAYVTGVCIDETLNTLYTAGGDLITSWCLDDGKELQCFEGHVGEIRSLSIISRPLVLGSSGADGVKLWRTDIGAEFFTVPLPESTKDLYPHLMQYINKNLYLCDLRGNLYVVNTETREIATLGIDNPNASQVFNFMMDPINDLMAIVNAAAEVKTYKISTGEEVATKSVSSNVLTSGGGIFSTSNTMRER